MYSAGVGSDAKAALSGLASSGSGAVQFRVRTNNTKLCIDVRFLLQLLTYACTYNDANAALSRLASSVSGDVQFRVRPKNTKLCICVRLLL